MLDPKKMLKNILENVRSIRNMLNFDFEKIFQKNSKGIYTVSSA